jgi:5-methylcytosine-specific restriction endonuclease McrA
LVICVIVYISNKRNKSNNIYKSGYSYKPSKPIIYKSEYDRLLQDERWKNKRNNILNRDNHKCQWCGKTTDLQIHHKYYNVYPNGNKANPWDYPDDALMTLCDACHKKYHNKYKVKTYYRKRYKHFE